MHLLLHNGACLPKTKAKIRDSMVTFNGCVTIFEKTGLKNVSKPLRIAIMVTQPL